MREATDAVVMHWQATGILDIGCAIAFWNEEHIGLHEDPRFQPFFERTGMRAYWEAFGPPEL